jgi:hypothetical protein
MQSEFDFTEKQDATKRSRFCSQIGMPKACVSCQKFVCIGYEPDEHHPLNGKFGTKTVYKTQTGICEFHNQKVFATEICVNYIKEVDAYVEDVKNRPSSLTRGV